MAEIRAAQFPHPVEVWAMDEHRIGLKPVRRRVWARRGNRPLAPVQHRYQWMYLNAFVEPCTGQTEWLLMPTVRADLFSLVLAHFAHAVDAGPDKHVVLLLDGAGWHTSKAVQVPEGLQLLFLPPSSPELQPAEHLWALTNEPLVNRHFRDRDELEAVPAQRCVTLQTLPEVIRSHPLFHWWPAAPTEGCYLYGLGMSWQYALPEYSRTWREKRKGVLNEK